MRFKAFKYRIYPNKEQELLIIKTIGCCRFVYNRALALRISLYNKEKKRISLFTLTKQLSVLKKQNETRWLKEVNSLSLYQSLFNLDNAYNRFFKEKKGFPKFKSKNNINSFGNPQNTTVNFFNKKVFFPKFKDGIHCVFDRQFNGKIKSSTVSRTPTGKYFISILVEEPINNPTPSEPKENKTLGIDLGLINYVTFSTGGKIKNPRHLKKKLKQLRRGQRCFSKKKKGSKNRNKQRQKVAILHEKVANCRYDFLHKLTTKIVENQDYDSYAIENLGIQEMMRNNKKLARHIGDAGWYMFRSILQYKCEWAGKNLLVIGRFEPSSRLCNCGYYNNQLSLKDREWICLNCNEKHDRDILAANNIRKFAFCEQNLNKNVNIEVPQELREFTPLETCVSRSSNKEIITTLV